METKVVKLEIGKVLAWVIAVVVVASVAGVILQNNYLKGDVVVDVKETETVSMHYFDRIETFKIDIEKLGYDKAIDGLKYDLDLMVSKKIIGAEIAKETIDAFSSIDDAKVIIDAIEVSISAYKLDIDGFIDAIEVSIPVYQDKVVLIDKIDMLATANVINSAVVLDVKESFIDLGIEKIETIKFDVALIETINTYDSVSFDVALESLNKEIDSGIELSVAFDTFDRTLDTIKQDIAIEVTKGLPESIASIDRGIDSQLDAWIDIIDTLAIDSVTIDQDILAKYLEAGKGFDILAKAFDTFIANIDKGIDIDSAIDILIKDADAVMPGMLSLKKDSYGIPDLVGFVY